MKTLRVGVIGLGTVGGGVARLLLERRAEIAARTGADLALVSAADLRADRAAALGLPPGVFTADAKILLARDDLDAVVELVGGLEPAGRFVLEALRRGRSVVTANKHLLAERLPEIAEAARAGGAGLHFEAAVAGGIPILKAVREGLAANRIDAVAGIVNGTCNYILTGMTEKEADFSVALAEAQAAGYAEADPALDVDGHDSAHKLAVLAALAFERTFPLKAIHVEGIRGITSEDVRYAGEMGFVVKLLAIGRRAGGAFELRVHPTLLERDHPLAAVGGVYNAVVVEADAVGRQMYYGRGAGERPTASAVVADLVDAALRRGGAAAPLLPGDVLPMAEARSRYFLRFHVDDRFGVLGRIATSLGKGSVSIQTVIQKEKRPDGVVPVVMLTHPAREADMRAALAEIDRADFAREPTALLRALAE